MTSAERSVHPSRKEFLKLAREHTLVPVCRTLTADLETPVSAFLRAAWPERECFLLESVEGGEQVGRYTFIGLAPFKRIVARGRDIAITEGRAHHAPRGRHLCRASRRARRPQARAPARPAAVHRRRRRLLRLRRRPPDRAPAHLAADELGVPDACLLFFDEVLAFDHVRKEIWLVVTADVTLASPAAAYDRAVRRLDRLEKRLAQPLPQASALAEATGKLKVKHRTASGITWPPSSAPRNTSPPATSFRPSSRSASTSSPASTRFQVYRALRTVNPSPYMFFLRFAPDGPLGSGAGSQSRKESRSRH